MLPESSMTFPQSTPNNRNAGQHGFVLKYDFPEINVTMPF